MTPLEYNSLKKIDKKKIILNVKKNGFAIVRGLFTENEIKKSVQKLKNKFSIKNDRLSSEGSPFEIFNNFQKLCVGSSSKSKEKIYRLHRIFYNPTWSEDIYGFRKIFIRFNKIRNIILGFKKNFCVYKPENNLWSACRILQYPSGGGHMSEHSDYILKNVSRVNFMNNFYQLILPITEKGKDFKNGGAFVIYKNKKISIEDELKIGDIIIYKSTIKHGVDEIDDNKKINLNKINGRIVLMNSLYQNFLTSKAKDKYFKKIN